MDLTDLQPVAAGFDPARLARLAGPQRGREGAPGEGAGGPGAVGRRGHVAYHCALGERDRERGVTLGDDTIFRIYSMTKPLVSIALMQLFERGMFQLDDPVARVVPAWRNHRVWVSGRSDEMVTEAAHRPVSVRALLSHTSGLTYGGVLPGMGDRGRPSIAGWLPARVCRWAWLSSWTVSGRCRCASSRARPTCTPSPPTPAGRSSS